jgi:putative MFS transporter
MSSQSSSDAPEAKLDAESDANLLTRLDRAPITRTLRISLSAIVLIWLIESFDIGLISTVILVLRPEWSLSAGEVGLLGASGTIGILVGILPAGRIADIYGRKRSLVIGTLLFAIFTLWSGLATSFTELIVLRIIAGLGEGAVFPAPYLLISELVNKNLRGRMMGYAEFVLNAGYTLPALAGIWAVDTFSPEWSWRAACILGGILPLVILPVIMIWVPESPRFLLRKAQRDNDPAARATVIRLVEKIEQEAELPHDKNLTSPEILAVLTTTNTNTSMSMLPLIKHPYLERSAISYAALTASFVVWYTLLVYAPVIFKGLGATQSNSLFYTGGMMLISAFGIFCQGAFADKYGRKPVFGVYMVLAAIGLAFLPFGGVIGMPLVVVAAIVTSWFGLGSFSVSKMYMAEQYPTRLRGVGVSTGELITRGLAGVVLVGLLPSLIAAWSVQVVLPAAGVLMILLTLPMMIFGIETHGRSMEELGTQVRQPSRVTTHVTGS